ncbi:MAG: hypothetical protein AAF702_29500 [Chloroflexota bacterium]
MFTGQLWKAFKDLAPEMVGLAFTVVVIDELNQIRIEQQRKQELIEQLYSPVRDIAVEALRLVRKGAQSHFYGRSNFETISPDLERISTRKWCQSGDF